MGTEKTEKKKNQISSKIRLISLFLVIGIILVINCQTLLSTSASCYCYDEIIFGEIYPVSNSTGMIVHESNSYFEIENYNPKKNISFQYSEDQLIYNPGDDLVDITLFIPVMVNVNLNDLKFNLKVNGESTDYLIPSNWDYIYEQLGEESYYYFSDFFIFFNVTLPSMSEIEITLETSIFISTEEVRPYSISLGFISESPNNWGEKYIKNIEFLVKGIQPSYYSSYNYEENFSNTTIEENIISYYWQIETEEYEYFHIDLSFSIPQRIVDNILFQILVFTGIGPVASLFIILFWIRLFRTLFLLKKNPKKLKRYRKEFSIKLIVLSIVICVFYYILPVFGLLFAGIVLPYLIHLLILLRKNKADSFL